MEGWDLKKQKDEGHLGGEVQLDTGEQTCLHFFAQQHTGKRDD